MTISELPRKGGKRQYSCRVWARVDGEKLSRYKGGFATKADAEMWGNDQLEQMRAPVAPAAGRTLTSFLTDYMTMRSDKLAASTARGYQTNISHIVDVLGPNMLLVDVTLLDVQRVVDTLARSGKKEATCRYVLRTMSVAMRYAIRVGLIVKNPCDGAEIRHDEQPYHYSIYSRETLTKLLMLLRENEHWLYPVVLLTARRGLRRGEALGLRWDDIDWETGLATIERSYGVEHKKLEDRRVKTKASAGKITVDGVFGDELRRIRESRLADGRLTVHVCERDDGERPSPSHVSHALHSFQSANGLPLCRVHDLRHTYAKHQYRGDLDELKRLMRHSKISITSELYLHDDVTELSAAVIAQDNILSFVPTKKDVKAQ